MMNKKTLWLTALAVLIFAPPLFAQYNPMTETPLEIIDKIPGTTTPTSQAQEEDIPFDPERGIILPNAGPHREPLRPQERAEEYLIQQADKELNAAGKPLEEEAIDPNKSYIERQIDELFAKVMKYGGIAINFIKEMLPFVWIVLKYCNMVLMLLVVPIIKLPIYISLPLLLLLYFLICYPLRKIAHTITNDEWMALVPPMQFVLLLRITERSYWSLILFLIPGVNLIFLTIVFKEICELLRQPPYYSILILIPGLNIALLWYLAYVGFD